MRTCLFDIDGTLLLTGGAGMYAFADAFQAEFAVAKLSREVPFAGRSDRGIAAALFEAHGIPNTDENWRRFYAAYVARLDDHLHRCGGEVLPGVITLIERLEAQGNVHLGLLTGNVAAAAKLKLTHYGLWDRFAFGGFGDEHPDRNDIAATALDRAREHHGPSTGQERVVVIGDTPNDVRCARAIGAYAVAVPTGHTDVMELAAANPDVLVENLTDHAAILEYLAA
ncbi:HAD family hydrolase [Botrimarina hoheduenensis]|uniref:Phosphoglycolate phosphatase n=1 Tax=Botrimarina hoheduenensis TaxID=2528000 RepID=A0A5C5VX77_9BACT|nr:HAD family hydrolase [Botrimarina hoheduenensis]TWT42543.1 Phosphoglycolate phosphatase [Botrimarina hoheduenensis]